MSEQMRKEFEAWCSDSLQRDPDGSYKQPFTRAFWLAWQAALATQPQAPQGAVTQEWRDVVADLASIVRLQNGNLHSDINELLSRAKTILAPNPETPEGAKP